LLPAAIIMAGGLRFPTSADVRALIEHVDRLCREGEQARMQADAAMRRKPLWPDRREPQWETQTDEPTHTSAGNRDSET
jgi:hypothetical protein